MPPSWGMTTPVWAVVSSLSGSRLPSASMTRKAAKRRDHQPAGAVIQREHFGRRDLQRIGIAKVEVRSPLCHRLEFDLDRAGSARIDCRDIRRQRDEHAEHGGDRKQFCKQSGMFQRNTYPQVRQLAAGGNYGGGKKAPVTGRGIHYIRSSVPWRLAGSKQEPHACEPTAAWARRPATSGTPRPWCRRCRGSRCGFRDGAW